MEGTGDKIDDPMCDILYKEEYKSIVTWSGIDTYAKIIFYLVHRGE